MDEQHFGLTKRPFRANPSGADVFIGPQTTRTVAGLRKALDRPDAVVTVTGRVGVGKTTLVTHALSTLGDSRIVVTVGRMRLDHDEVLELLLNELGTRQTPTGTVQRFSLFRRLLKDFSDKGTRVFVVVEDAKRIGSDALSELEALTAADAGVSDGANIVLMGEPGINEQMKTPGLARMNQRIRLRQSVLPLGETELVAYLQHCCHLDSGDFDSVFADGTAKLLHQLSAVIPRVANNVVETILGSAADHNLDCITAAFIKDFVADECGLTMQLTESTTAPQSATDPTPVKGPVARAEITSGAVAPQVSSVNDSEKNEPSPELIQDTLPDLEVLAPELAAMPTSAELKAESIPELTPDPETNAKLKSAIKQDAVPTLVSENSAEQSTPAVSANIERATVADKEEIPAWDRDPTLAQLRPDLNELERAMAVTLGEEPEAEPDVPVEKAPDIEAQAPGRVPEITLDREIQEKIDEATEILKKTTSDLAEVTATEEVKTTTRKPEELISPVPPGEAEQHPNKAATELQKISSELAKAKTIDDVDDEMAETLFGQDFSDLAARVAAMVAADQPSDEPANDNSQLVADEAADAPPAPGVAAAVAESEAIVDVMDGTDDFSTTALHRLATVRLLNENHRPAVEPVKPVVSSDDVAASSTPTSGEQPESIEDQINTSLTQTQAALDARLPPDIDEDGDDADRSGFLNRFRRPDSA